MKKYYSIVFCSIIFTTPEIILSAQRTMHIPQITERSPGDKSPGHEHDDKILAAGFCEILLHGAAAIAAKDNPEAQIKEAALVAANIITLLQLAARCLPHDSEVRSIERSTTLHELHATLDALLQDPKFLKELEYQHGKIFAKLNAIVSAGKIVAK
jgi:hypothetical protein